MLRRRRTPHNLEEEKDVAERKDKGLLTVAIRINTFSGSRSNTLEQQLQILKLFEFLSLHFSFIDTGVISVLLALLI